MLATPYSELCSKALAAVADIILNSVVAIIAMEDSINEADLAKLLGWCRRGKLQKLQDLLETFTGDVRPLLSRQQNGRSMIHEAAMNGHSELLEWLLRQGGDPNCGVSSSGGTPLHAAVSYGMTQCIQVLLEHGADVFAIDSSGATPIHVAGVQSRKNILAILNTTGM